MTWKLNPDRYFDPEPTQRGWARKLYESVAALPIVSPHGHVDPKLFADEHSTFGTPTELLIIPDHYVFRMLHSQGIPLENLGIPRVDGGWTETDHRKIWQIFADHYYLFRGTPSGAWLDQELIEVLGVEEKLNGENAQEIYDQIAEKLASPAFQPRRLLDTLNIEVMSTTDFATDPLEAHQAMHASGMGERIVPAFRPDAVVNLDTEGWQENIARLGELCGFEVVDYKSFIRALENRRAFFKEMGCHATDHAAFTAYTMELSGAEADAIFQRALKGIASEEDARRFTGHMLIELARMSIDDGLVMQVHVGSFRNHNPQIFERFGRDKGMDIPISSEFTQNFRPLLSKFGTDPRLQMILFTLDEDVYSRELAPLAGVYPALRIGPPWWFFDSPNGMAFYFNRVTETAGIYNLVGFNDDTRAFLSIPARHDVWRRVACNWTAGMLARGRIDEEDAREMVYQLAYALVKKAYRFD
ncbi:MAG: glucuronate isomerase [Anaerolineaceae bacterium]|nr:glucuronate isomerase [Anaerolineaceae bacterium]